MSEEKTIYVYADWFGSRPRLMGRLYANAKHGNELFSFEYSKEWLSDDVVGFPLDPDLHMYEGRQYLTPSSKTSEKNKQLFGIFTDSCPDRWGRLLLKRKEAMNARAENRKPRVLLESDYLLGVHDLGRMGAIRYCIEENGQFLAVSDASAIPPWTTLRTLESASLSFENNEDGQEELWLNQLLAPGSSLGGARPKATVQAPDGSLWIAKFPSRHDECNSGVWEIVVHDLAVKCSLNVPQAKVETFSDKGATFLVKRFDRNGDSRVHFSSAMALLGKTDGEEASYLSIASLIKSNGAAPERDLKELWRRIVFNMAVSNTDDHLRNHGFLLTECGWSLSPMFDVNPGIYGNALSLNVSQGDAAIDFELALETANYYGIDIVEAKNIIADMCKTIGNNWRNAASEYGLGRNAINQMEPAFVKT